MALGSDAMVRPFDNRANLKKTAWIMRQADLLNGDSVAVNQAIEKIIGKTDIPKLIAPKGVDLEVFHANDRKPSQGSKRLIMVKNHVPVSRFDTLFTALTPLRKNPYDFQLNIFGDGPPVRLGQAGIHPTWTY